jgi:4-hydroxybenzoate polyprenyltransferase
VAGSALTRRLYAVLGLMRISAVVDPVLLVAPGWLAADDPPGAGRLLAFALAVVVARGASNAINDLIDFEEDSVVAPWMALPSGAVRLESLAPAFGLAVGGVAGLCLLAAGSVGRAALTLGVLGVGTAVVTASTIAKRRGIAGPLLAGVGYAVAPLAAWLAAGGGAGFGDVAWVLAVAFAYGFATNVHAAIRDFENDPLVGVRTIAVRIGVGRAIVLAGSADLMALAFAVGLGVTRERGYWFLAVALALAVALVISYGRLRRETAGPRALDRASRVRATGLLQRLRLGPVLVATAALEPALAAGIAALLLVLLPLLLRGEHAAVRRNLQRRSAAV